MLYTAFALAVLMMHRLGLFDEYYRYREAHRLDEHVMRVADDATWDDRMETFRKSHPHLQRRCYMQFG
jgi:hypothetical protein